EQLISQNQNLLKYQYAPYDRQTILLLACNDQHGMDKVTGATVETLINLGGNCNEPSSKDHWQPIHYAAINSNKEKLEAIIQHLSPEQLNPLVCCSKENLQKYSFSPKKVEKTYSNNALSVLLKFGNRNEQFHECCQLLIDKGINVHQADSNSVAPSDT